PPAAPPPAAELEPPPPPPVPVDGTPASTGALDGTSVASATWQPSAEVDTVNISGCPVMPAPAVMVTPQRSPSTAAVTVERPSACSGASNTMCRPADAPGTAYVMLVPAMPRWALEATT